MLTFNAYCLSCLINVEGKVNKIKALDSGKKLYVGECPICCFEIKRVVP